MNRTEHLLSIVAEECMEVAQRATKALRFGMCEVQPGQPHINAKRLSAEICDLIGVLEMLEDESGIKLLPFPECSNPDVRAKKKKVEHFLSYSAERGTLDAD